MKHFVFGMAVATVGYFLWQKFDVTGKLAHLIGRGEQYAAYKVQKLHAQAASLEAKLKRQF